MKEVRIRYVFDQEPTDAVRKAMVQYGYGYEYCVFTEQYDNGMAILVADAHCSLDEATLETVLDYYQGDNMVQHVIGADGTLITLEEAI